MKRYCHDCGGNMYGYSDGFHVVFLCYKCGNFCGQSNGDKKFEDVITKKPSYLLKLIDDEILYKL